MAKMGKVAIALLGAMLCMWQVTCVNAQELPVASSFEELDRMQSQQDAPNEGLKRPISQPDAGAGQNSDFAEYLYVTASGGLNMRSRPSTDSFVLNKYPYGSAVRVLDRLDEWVKVWIREQTGWMHGDYLSATKPASRFTARHSISTPGVKLSRRQIVQRIIQRSRQSYYGNCACPYDRDRAGRRCGRRSAWSRPGGRSPLCYARDVTSAMVNRFTRK